MKSDIARVSAPRGRGASQRGCTLRAQVTGRVVVGSWWSDSELCFSYVLAIHPRGAGRVRLRVWSRQKEAGLEQRGRSVSHQHKEGSCLCVLADE